MVETKVLKVDVDSEQECISTMEKFGWILKSSQEINVKESHLEGGVLTDNIYSVTTSEHYVKLVFSRDTAMSGYGRITELENEYFECMRKKPTKPESYSMITGLILLAFGGVPAVIYTVNKVKAFKRYNESLAVWNSELSEKGRVIFAETAALMCG